MGLSTSATRTAFDLALHATHDVGTPQPFLHFGFRLATDTDVRDALDRVRADGMEVIEHHEEPDVVSRECVDPDGHRVEVYCEPQHLRCTCS